VAGEDYQPVVDGLENIRAALAGIHQQLTAAAGVGIKALPPEVTWSIQRMAGVQVQVSPDLQVSLPPTAQAVADLSGPLEALVRLWAKTWPEIVSAGLQDLSAGIHSALQDLPEAIRAAGWEVSGSVAALGAGLGGIQAALEAGLSCICSATNTVAGNLAAGLRDLKVMLEIPWDELAERAGPWLEALLPRLLGPEPQPHSPAPAWLSWAVAPLPALRLATWTGKKLGLFPEGKDMMEAAKDWALEKAGPVLQDLWQDLLRGVQGQTDGPVSRIFATIQNSTTFLVDKWLEFMGAGPVAPENVKERLDNAYLFSAGMGIAAHLVSTILSLDVLGTLDLNATGLAAFLADLGGFGPMVSNIMGPFYRAYLGQPWTYHVNRQLRPAIPDLRTLMEMRYKARVDETIAKVVPGAGQGRDDEWFKLLSYYGFSDDWCRAIEAHLYREPRYFELTMMGEADETFADPDWWNKKVARMGYDATDGRYLQQGLKRRLARRYIDGYVSELMDLVDLGVLTPEDLRPELEEAGLSPLAVDFAVRQAEVAWQAEEIRNGIYALKQAYSRDEITEEELREGLDGLGLRAEKVDWIVHMERLKRYRKVYLQRPSDIARKAVSTYRQAYRAGLMPEGEYVAALSAAGMDPEVMGWQLELDRLARDKTIASHLRRWHLPALRERVLAGELSLGSYTAQLRAMDFPDRYLDAEVEYVRMLLERQQRRQVRRPSVSVAERAYRMGLLSRAGLLRLYHEAALPEVEIALRAAILDELRRKDLADGRRLAEGLEVQPPSPRYVVAEAEWDYVGGRVSEAQLRQTYRAHGYSPDRVERRLEALRPLRG